jgi:hypothetical protein
MEIAGAFLIILAVATPGMSGLVLCVGPNGHISFESAHEGKCHDADQRSGQGPGMVSAEAEDCCGGCVDVSLSSEYVSPVIKDVRRDRILTCLASPILAVVTETRDAPVAERQPDPRAEFMPSSALRALRTIVQRT